MGIVKGEPITGYKIVESLNNGRDKFLCPLLSYLDIYHHKRLSRLDECTTNLKLTWTDLPKESFGQADEGVSHETGSEKSFVVKNVIFSASRPKKP